MKTGDAKRQALLERLADHVLAAGLQGASLRPLAAAAGTSDRMLLYYFEDKEELLTATLGVIAARLMRLLDEALPDAQAYSVLLPRVCALMRSDAMTPYVQIWLELAAYAARKEEPFRDIAGQLCDGFLAWTAARLKVDREKDRAAKAALLFATVEGLVLVNAMGREGMVSAALGAVSSKTDSRGARVGSRSARRSSSRVRK